MTYKQGCKYAALLGIPCLIFDVITRMPPFYHVPAMRRLAQDLGVQAGVTQVRRDVGLGVEQQLRP